MDVSFVTRAFYGFAVALVVSGVLGVAVAKGFGWRSKKQQKAVAQLVFAAGMILFMLLVMPRLLGAS